jgi:hypothetical protein
MTPTNENINDGFVEDSDSWAYLDLKAADATLSDGDYTASIITAEIFKATDALWFKVEFALDDTGYIPAPILEAVAARPGSKSAARVADGLRRLHQIAAATGVTLPDNLSPDKIASLFTGRRVLVRCASKRRNGVLELVVRNVLPLASEATGDGDK